MSFLQKLNLLDCHFLLQCSFQDQRRDTLIKSSKNLHSKNLKSSGKSSIATLKLPLKGSRLPDTTETISTMEKVLKKADCAYQEPTVQPLRFISLLVIRGSFYSRSLCLILFHRQNNWEHVLYRCITLIDGRPYLFKYFSCCLLAFYEKTRINQKVRSCLKAVNWEFSNSTVLA